MNQLLVTEQFGHLRCCIPEMEEAVDPVGSHEEEAKQGDDHLHKQLSLERCKSHLHSEETNDSFSVGVWPRDPSRHLLLLDRAPNLAHTRSLVLDEGVEKYDGEGKEKVEEQPNVDEGHLYGGGQ